MSHVVILGGARSAIGTFGGSLASMRPAELGSLVTAAAMARAGVDPEMIGHVVFGHIINTEPKDMYVSRLAAMGAGIPERVPSMNVNRLCGSGLQAIVSAGQNIMLGDADFAVAGGTEVMSRSPYIVPAARWGQKMGDIKAEDMMLGALTCPFGTGHMGVTAENVAREYGVSRADQDAFALESQTRAARAISAGRFADEIVPVEIKTRKGTVIFDTDEHPKSTTLEALSQLRPAFEKEGTVTAGNASGLNDGAAALVLAREEAARAAGLQPRFRVLGYAHAGVRPDIMGVGPIPAVEKLCARLGLSVGDFDVIESNEAFAAQAIAVNRALGLDTSKVNPNGGAIALGHPVGATGAIITLKAMSALTQSDGQLGLVTMCIGGGQGIALAIEKIT